MRKTKAAIQNRTGFTLIEVLMAVLLIAILATIAITQFTNFSRDTKNAATRENLGILRNAIQKHYGTMRIRCEATGTFLNKYPALDSLQANDITAGATTPCDTTDLPEAADRYFVAGGLPANPWSDKTCGVNRSAVAANDAVDSEMNIGVAVVAANLSTTYTTGNCGWQYDETTGRIKANTNNNGIDRDGRYESSY
jgi:prepilin-type N-terminal cleavage/methylation domain-containing protein